MNAVLNDKKITVEIPTHWVVDAGDYHEFKALKNAYGLIGLNVNFEEVGCDGRYHAVFWVGLNKPTNLINRLKQKYKLWFD